MVKTWRCEKTHLKKGAWSPEEDQMLKAYIKRYGIWNWNEMSKAAGLARSGKSCRLRWVNYLRPDIKHGNFSEEEKETILTLHKTLGNRWSAIAAKLTGRTDNEVKNYWHTHLKKHLKQLQANSSAAFFASESEPDLKDETFPEHSIFESTEISFPNYEPSESSKLEGSSSNVLVPPQDELRSKHEFSSPVLVTTSAPLNCETGKHDKKEVTYNNRTVISTSDVKYEEIQSWCTESGGNNFGGSVVPSIDHAQATFIDHPIHNATDQLVGPSTEAMWQQEPIWPYDYFYELESVCNDWVNYMDTMF